LVLDRVLGALRAAGIHAAPLKGLTLAQEAYGRIDVRPSADLDVLVYARDLHAACSVLVALGWDSPQDFVESDGLPWHHFRLHSATAPSVELHWRMHWHERDFCRQALERAALAAPEGGAGQAGTLRLRSDDHLALLLMGYARDGFRGLRIPADIAALVRATQPLAEARIPQALLPSVVSAAIAVRDLLGVDPFEGTDRGLGRSRGVRAALALWDPLLRLEGTKNWADLYVVDVLLAPPSGLGAALRRRVWPPVPTMPERKDPGWIRARLPHLEYLARAARGFAMTVPRMARAMRSPRR
jgi:hypothetical protein